MGFGQLPSSPFGDVTIRVVEPGTVLNNHATGEKIVVEEGTVAFSGMNTALCVQADFDRIKGAVKDVKEV